MGDLEPWQGDSYISFRSSFVSAATVIPDESMDQEGDAAAAATPTPS